MSEIPEPPREPRWRSCMRKRWVLGLVGGLLFFNGVVVSVVFWLVGAGLPFHDIALDSGAAISSDAEVTKVEIGSMRINGYYGRRLYFRFRTEEGEDFEGSSVAQSPKQERKPGPCVVEYMAADPSVARVRGTKVAMASAVLVILASAMVLPGFVLLLLWLRGVMALRVMLRDGRLVMTRITRTSTRLGVNPRQLVVEYEFDDDKGTRHTGKHWVTAKTPLGRELDNGQRAVPAIYDEATPDQNRLVHVADFLPASTTLDSEQPG